MFRFIIFLFICPVFFVACKQEKFQIKEAKQIQEWEIEKKNLEVQLMQCLDDWEKVNLLRNYVASTVDGGGNESYYNSLEGLTLEQQYYLFKNDACSAYCGGHADMLMNLYGAFDFPSCKLYIKSTECPFSHVLNIVEINRKGQPMIVVQDAYYNYTLVDSNGGPKDFFLLYHELKQGYLGNTFILESAYMNYKDYLLNYEDLKDAGFKKRLNWYVRSQPSTDELKNIDIKSIRKSCNAEFPLKIKYEQYLQLNERTKSLESLRVGNCSDYNIFKMLRNPYATDCIYGSFTKPFKQRLDSLICLRNNG